MTNTSKIIPKNKTNSKIFTKSQKEKIIRRFKNEMIQKEKDFQTSVDNEVKMLRLKFNNRLNKILRKFWDVKIEDILNVEREIKDDTRLTLFHVIKQLEALKKSRQTNTE